jgi:hypothetical protein
MTDCNNYRGISLFSTAYKILSNILLARLTPYVNEIIGNHQCRFHHNRSTTDQIFYIQQILEKNGSIMGWCISYLRPLGRPRRRWEDNIKLDLRETGINGANWIQLAQGRMQWRAFVNTVMNVRVS